MTAGGERDCAALRQALRYDIAMQLADGARLIEPAFAGKGTRR